MYRTALRKISSDITARKFRTFLVSASIAVGVIGIIALFTTSNLISSQLAEDIKPSELSMVSLAVRPSGSVALDNEAYLATLNRQNEQGIALDALEGIDIVEGWLFYDISWKQPNQPSFDNAQLRAFYTPLAEARIEPVRLLEGAFPDPAADEVALEKRMADLHQLGVGDSIVFRVTDENGVAEQTYTVSGIVFHPYSARTIGGTEPGPLVGIYAERDHIQRLVGTDALTDFVARYETFEQAQAQFEAFVRTIAEITPYAAQRPSIENPDDNILVENASVFTDILNALAIATMIVSGFLVVNVINTIVAEQKRQIGVMKSIGSSNADTFLIYSGIALIYGLIGTAVGVVPGLLLGQAITNILAPQLDLVIEGFNWSPQAVFIGIIMGLVIPILAAAIPVWNGIRVSIMEALTDLGIKSDYGDGAVSKAIGRLPLPISAKQAVSNVYQKRWSLILTVITLTTTIATFMGTSALTVSVTTEINAIFDRLGYQMIVFPNEIDNRDDIENTLNGIAAVTDVSPASVVFIQLEGDYVNFFTGDNQVQIFGLDPNAPTTVLTFDLIEGQLWSDDSAANGIVISQAVANQLGLEAGDLLDVVVAGDQLQIPVLGIDSNGFDAANMLWQDISRLAGFVEGAPAPNEYVVLATEDTLGEVVVIGTAEGNMSLAAGGFDQNDPGIILTERMAENAGLGEGDSLSLRIDGQSVTREVLAVVPASLLAANAPAQLADDIPENLVLFGYGDLTGITGLESSGDPLPNGYYVTIDKPDASGSQVDEYINDIQTTLLDAGITASYVNQVEQQEISVASAETSIGIFQLAAILIAIVGAIGLLTTLTISVFERQKEIGVMRSIGAGSVAISSQFMLEGVIVGVISWLVGLPISYVIAIAFNTVANLEAVPFTYPLTVPIVGLAGMVIIAVLSSLGPSLVAARKTVSEILRYQ